MSILLFTAYSFGVWVYFFLPAIFVDYVSIYIRYKGFAGILFSTRKVGWIITLLHLLSYSHTLILLRILRLLFGGYFCG